MNEYLLTEWTRLADQCDAIAETYEHNAADMRRRAEEARAHARVEAEQ